MLNLKTERICFVTGFLSLFIFLTFLYFWINNLENKIYHETGSVSEYPIENKYIGNFQINSLIRKHLSCSFDVSDKQENKEILISDDYIEVDKACLSKEQTKYMSLTGGEYKQTILSSDKYKKFRTSYLDEASMIYVSWLEDWLSEMGVDTWNLKLIKNECVIEKRKPCVIQDTYLYFTPFKVLKKDWQLGISLFVAIIGFVLAFFYSPIRKLYLLTCGKIINWISSGK